MHNVAVPDPTCPGCLGDGKCWVCLGTGRLRRRALPDVDCHVCGGTARCASCPVVIDLVPAQQARDLDAPVAG